MLTIRNSIMYIYILDYYYFSILSISTLFFLVLCHLKKWPYVSVHMSSVTLLWSSFSSYLCFCWLFSNISVAVFEKQQKLSLKPKNRTIWLSNIPILWLFTISMFLSFFLDFLLCEKYENYFNNSVRTGESYCFVLGVSCVRQRYT